MNIVEALHSEEAKLQRQLKIRAEKAKKAK
jgi:hypothetical protein